MTLNKVTSEGSHEALWIEFARLATRTSNQILSQPGATVSAQSAAAKLTELQAALTGGGLAPSGNWLSTMRNRVNYQHAFGAWFPYDGHQSYYDALFEKVEDWRGDPDTLSIRPQPGREIQRFIETCAVLVRSAESYRSTCGAAAQSVRHS